MHKRVLLISENYPPITGGSGRWFFEIYSRLGCERMAVLSTNEVDDGPPHQPRPQLEEHRMQWGFSDWSLLNPKSLIRYAYLLREAIRIAREIKAEAVHCGRNLPERDFHRPIGEHDLAYSTGLLLSRRRTEYCKKFPTTLRDDQVDVCGLFTSHCQQPEYRATSQERLGT